MKNKTSFLIWLLSLMFFPSCSNGSEKAATQNDDTLKDTVLIIEKPQVRDSLLAYSEMRHQENCFLVVSKQELMLYVCEVVGEDTMRIAEFPVCMGKNLGHKQKKGDMRTPESGWKVPFVITQIQDASGWTHDFGDGRGEILAYGNWFLRLATPGFSGIGIHGSTNNENTIPGRASEGCIRLRNDDLDLLKARYAYQGMRVIVKGEEEGLKPFEQKYY